MISSSGRVVFFDGSIVLQSRRFIRSEWYRIPVAFFLADFSLKASTEQLIIKLRDGWVVNVFGATLRSSRRLASNADTKFLGGYQFVLALLKCLVTFLHIATYWSCWAVIDDPCCLEMVYHALKGFVLQLNGLLGPLGAHKWFTKAPRSHSKFNNECPDLFRFFSIFYKIKDLLIKWEKRKDIPSFLGSQ